MSKNFPIDLVKTSHLFHKTVTWLNNTTHRPRVSSLLSTVFHAKILMITCADFKSHSNLTHMLIDTN